MFHPHILGTANIRIIFYLAMFIKTKSHTENIDLPSIKRLKSAPAGTFYADSDSPYSFSNI